MKHLFRNTFWAIIVIVVGAFIIAYSTSTTIPRAFFEARINTAGAANNLARLINNSLTNLHRIETFEQNKSHDQALEMLRFEIGQKQEKQNSAVLLATDLEDMAKAALEINAATPRGLAIEAVTSGVSMVSRIVSYNSSMDELFAAIQNKILNGSAASDTNIRALLASINADGKAINDLNDSFNETLKKFDENYGTK